MRKPTKSTNDQIGPGVVREPRRHPLGGHRRDSVAGDRRISQEFQREHAGQGQADDTAHHPDDDLIAHDVAKPPLPVFQRGRRDGEDHSDVRERDRPAADRTGNRADLGPHSPALVASVIREQGVGQSARPRDRGECRQQGPVDVRKAAMPPPETQPARLAQNPDWKPRHEPFRSTARGRLPDVRRHAFPRLRVMLTRVGCQVWSERIVPSTLNLSLVTGSTDSTRKPPRRASMRRPVRETRESGLEPFFVRERGSRLKPSRRLAMANDERRDDGPAILECPLHRVLR